MDDDDDASQKIPLGLRPIGRTSAIGNGSDIGHHRTSSIQIYPRNQKAHHLTAMFMLPITPIACLAFVNSRAIYSNNRKMTQCLKAVSRDALASIPSLKSPDGSLIAADAISDKLKGKRVALYFAAGWCPMCTSFEPGLLQFREAAVQSGKDMEIIYVPSDRSDSDMVKRTTAMGMMSVPIGEEADAMKTRFKIWAGAESAKLGTGRRSGVPALVVLDSEKGEELKFLAAESKGVKALSDWPLDDACSIW